MPSFVFFLSWLSLFEQQLFSGKWQQPPPTSKVLPPFEKGQITQWCLSSLHPPVVILVNMMTRCGGYCSISAHLSSRATLLVNHILDSFVIPSKAHLTRETRRRCRHHHHHLPLSLIFYDRSCITALFDSYSFDVLHWKRKRHNNENVAALITCKSLKGKAVNDRYAH